MYSDFFGLLLCLKSIIVSLFVLRPCMDTNENDMASSHFLDHGLSAASKSAHLLALAVKSIPGSLVRSQIMRLIF